MGENATVTAITLSLTDRRRQFGGDPWDHLRLRRHDSKEVPRTKDDGRSSVSSVRVAERHSVVKIDTFGSNFDTMLRLQVPTAIWSRTTTPPSATSQSSVEFLAQVGELFRIEVGYDGATGSITLNIVSATAGTVQLSASTYSVNATAGTITIPITRTGGTTGAASVELTTTQGTAKAGTDYTTTTKTVNWASGSSTTQDVTIPILNSNGLDGSAPQFTIGLEDVSGATIGTPSTAAVTINESSSAAPARSRWGHRPTVCTRGTASSRSRSPA